MANFRPGYLDRGQPLGATRKQVMLNADNLQVDLAGVSYLELSSDNTTAANRTFTLVQSNLVGHMVRIVLVSGSSTTCELLDSGTVRLESAWRPLQNDSLSLMWNGTAWIEIGRSMDSQAPSHVVKYAGLYTSVAGSATQPITVTGVVAGDLVFCQLRQVGATPRTILTAIPSTDTVTVVMSGDPSTDHILQYQVLRAV